MTTNVKINCTTDDGQWLCFVTSIVDHLPRTGEEIALHSQGAPRWKLIVRKVSHIFDLDTEETNPNGAIDVVMVEIDATKVPA